MISYKEQIKDRLETVKKKVESHIASLRTSAGADHLQENAKSSIDEVKQVLRSSWQIVSEQAGAQIHRLMDKIEGREKNTKPGDNGKIFVQSDALDSSAKTNLEPKTETTIHSDSAPSAELPSKPRTVKASPPPIPKKKIASGKVDAKH